LDNIRGGIMDNKYIKLFFENVIDTVKIDQEKLIEAMMNASPLCHYYEGKTDGALCIIDMLSKQLGKPIMDDETIEEYYKRWLSGYERDV
jgi:hypothetical protein